MLKKLRENNALLAALAIVVGILVKIAVPAANGLTPAGVTFLAVFVASMVILIIAAETFWGCLFGIVALGAVQLIPVSDLFKAAFGNSTVALVIAVLALAHAMSSSGVAQWIAKWFLSRKVVEGRPMVFVLFAILAETVIAVFVDAIMGLVVLIAIGKASFETLGISKSNPLYRAYMLAMLWPAGFTQLIIPFGKVMPALMISMAESFGFAFPLGQYLALSVPLILITGIPMPLLIVYFTLRPNDSAFKNYNALAVREELKANPLTPRGKFTLAMMLLSFLFALLPWLNLGMVSDYFRSYESALCYYVPLLLLVIVPIQGKPVLDLKETAKNLPWSIIMLLAYIMTLSAYIGHADFGVTAWISGMMTPVAEALSPVALLFVSAILTVILTNFISNMVTMALTITVFTPPFITMFNAGTSSIHPVAVIMLLGLVANYSCLTPGCCPGAGILFGSGDLKMGESVYPNLVFMIGGALLATVITLAVNAIAF